MVINKKKVSKKKALSDEERLVLYLEDVIRSNPVEIRAQSLRLKIKIEYGVEIPIDGFIFDESEREKVKQDKFAYFPEEIKQIMFPHKFPQYMADLDLLIKESFPQRESGMINIIFHLFVLFNKSFISDFKEELLKELTQEGLCVLVDYPTYFKKYNIDLIDINNKYNSVHLFMLARETKHRPLAFFVHPQITRNQLVAYIDQHWSKEIKPILDKYNYINPGIKKIRKNRINEQQALKDFVYENRDESPQGLLSLVLKEFPKYEGDLGTLNTMKRREIKKRQQL